MTPSGSPASFQSSAIAFAADGSFSDGLITTLLPQATAIGTNHIGTMAGKLNGEMTAHDAERLADRVHVDLRRHALAEPALEQVRDAAGELDHLEAAGHLAERVGQHLAVLGGDQRGDLAPCRWFTSSRNANSTCVRLASDVCAQSGDAAWRVPTTSSTVAAEARSSSPVTSPVAGL